MYKIPQNYCTKIVIKINSKNVSEFNLERFRSF